jgi:hypothetical protein
VTFLSLDDQARALEILSLPWLFADRFAGRAPRADHVASTTYIQARKPPA